MTNAAHAKQVQKTRLVDDTVRFSVKKRLFGMKGVSSVSILSFKFE